MAPDPRAQTPVARRRGAARAGTVAFFALCLPGLGVASAVAQTLAFPGAEGHGRFASGGRGGDVYIVRNLNDSGIGSLREGVVNRAAGVPRTIVFAVSGTLYLQSTLRITKGDLTIAGQSAPGDGICLAYHPVDPSNSTNVVIRFLRSRLGDTAGRENDAFSCRYASNVIVDHCSFSWSVDETASSYDNTNFTMQWCIISESLRDSVHSKGPHGYGAIWGGLGASFHHNLVAHHDSRNPRLNGARTHGTDRELVDIRNNVVYNWRGNSTYGGEPSDTGLPARHNLVNNTYKAGPATSTTSAVRYRILEPTRNSASTGATLSLFHVSGNHTTASAGVTADNWNGGVQVVSSSEFAAIRADTPFAVPPVITQTGQTSYPLVLAYSGSRLPARDSVDTRIVQEVATGTATYRGSKNDLPGIIDSQADVGGWPSLSSTPAPLDQDADGMPDTWENARGLNPLDASDRNLTDADGYTHLELYLNELAAAAFPIPSISTQPAPSAVDAGRPFSLSVSVAAPAGAGAPAYQWYRAGAPIADAVSPEYAVASATSADAGAYHVVVKNSYGSVASSAVAVAVVDAYAVFVRTHGLESASTGAPAADPDGDGLPNALEFLLGGAPASAASAPAPVFARAPGETPAADLVFNRRKDHAELFDLVVELSTDLAGWTPAPLPGDGVELTVTPLDDTMERITVRLPLGSACRFARLRATMR